MSTSPTLSVETKSGIKYITLQIENGKAVGATVDMGKAILKPRDIPVDADGEDFVKRTISVAGKDYTATCVSMGNPHCIIFMEDDPMALDLPKIGPDFENHKLFPLERINTEVVRVLDYKFFMGVWATARQRREVRVLGRVCGGSRCHSAKQLARQGEHR